MESRCGMCAQGLVDGEHKSMREMTDPEQWTYCMAHHEVGCSCWKEITKVKREVR